MTNSKSAASKQVILPVHLAAGLFPMMTDTELRELGADIQKNGLMTSIAIAVERVGTRLRYSILDGRNRLAGMEKVGLKPQFVLDGPDCALVIDGLENYPQPVIIEHDHYSYVMSANIQRRHLTARQRRELISKLLQAQPEKPDRQIAGMVGASHVTVGAERANLVGRGQIDHVLVRADTRGRRQPGTKNKPVPSPIAVPTPEPFLLPTAAIGNDTDPSESALAAKNAFAQIMPETMPAPTEPVTTVVPSAITKLPTEAKPNAALTRSLKAAIGANQIPEFSGLLDRLGIELGDVVVCARRATRH
jgi:hypothetical protein